MVCLRCYKMLNTLKTQNEELAKDNKKYQKINKELRAKKNGIKAVTASDKPDKTPGENKPRGRTQGAKSYQNYAPYKHNQNRGGRWHYMPTMQKPTLIDHNRRV